MRKIFIYSLFIMLAAAHSASAKDGFSIRIKLKNVKDSMAYLAHYYGKPLPTLYKTDSATFDKSGSIHFQSKEKTLGGIYIVLLANKQTYFEVILNNGDDMEVSGDVKELPTSLRFKNSPENTKFVEYVTFLTKYGKEQDSLAKQFAEAKTLADTQRIRSRSREISNIVADYRHEYVNANPASFLAHVFNALEVPQVPEGKHLLPSGEEDSNFAYNYYKDHYWDKFDFKDDRLINAPVYDQKLEEYFNKLILPYEDTVEKESDMVLRKAKGSPELYKYSLWWLTRNAEGSKVMGMDAVFVYLVENYFMKGEAGWLKAEELEKYVKRAHEIAPNVIGNLAPNVKLPDTANHDQQLTDVKAKYTVLIFWATDCGHCQAEIPKLDSLYKAVLKKKGVKIFAVRTDDDDKKWREMINKIGFQDWINVWNNHTSRYRDDYDVYSTPTIYLLDENKIIRGKRIDHSNLVSLIEMLERKEKEKSKSN